MDSRKRDIIEVVGFISIVASLLFVGMQLVLDRRVAVGAQFHARTELWHEAMMTNLQDDVTAQAWGNYFEAGNLPGYWSEDLELFKEQHDFDMTQMYKEVIDSNMAWLRLNNNYFQYQQGLIPEETWQQLLGVVRNRLQNPLHRATGRSGPNLEQGFQDTILEMIAAQ